MNSTMRHFNQIENLSVVYDHKNREISFCLSHSYNYEVVVSERAGRDLALAVLSRKRAEALELYQARDCVEYEPSWYEDEPECLAVVVDGGGDDLEVTREEILALADWILNPLI